MNKKTLLSIFLIIFLVSISAVSAQDNGTDVENVIEDASDIEEIDLAQDNTVSVENNASEVLSVSEESEVGEGDDIYAQTMYFNASSPSDGDGSRNNPFKYVTDARLPYGVTAYFANGVYEIESTCDLYSNDGVLVSPPSKVTFYGESTDGVIFKCTNSSAVAFRINNMARLFAYNMTFDNAVIENRGTLEANGIVFKNGVAVDTTAYAYPTRNNAFGGAIYSPGSNYFIGYGMKSYLTLNNCLFMNNSAVYGGSIYHKYGNTIIRNTKFIDSYASLYGGVLATDGGDIIIENCEFVNCHAAGDAGGAIYSKVTNLTVKNSNFTNGYGDFGGAICNLNSDLIVENCNFYNNSAKLEGGAIYVMYGNVDINNCNITLSTALDGGALFEDNCSSIIIRNTNFDKSLALRYGGTIFSNGLAVTMENVLLGESDAAIGPIVYHQDKYDYDIGYNTDYEMIQYNSSYAGVLPSRYDLREEGYVTPVRDQQAGGNCWAFAGIAALESCIYKATGKSIDLSEENVKNLIELYSAYGWKYDTNEGGHSEMTWGHLISWLGPVLEEDDIYDDYSTLSTLFDAVMHVQNVYYLPTRQNALDNYAIKKAIMDYGGVSVGIYWDDSPLNWDKNTNSYYLATSTSAYPNHAVCIVGWDDNFDKNNFPLGDMASTNGAWIVKNSWGEEWGDNGYFYVSYYDPVVYAVGEKNDVFTFILNDTVRYNRNYQYDIGGMTDFLYPGATTVYYKNTFTAIGNDILSAFSTIFNQENDYVAKLYINDELKLTQSGHSFGGYATIPFTQEFQLTAGDKFTIEIKVSEDSEASLPICEMVTATRLTYSEGISFFSTDGKTWKDLYSFVLDRPDFDDGHRYASQVACIKAFTRSGNEVIESSMEISDVLTNVGKSTSISAVVKDVNGKLIKTGYVTFEINGKKETVKVSDGSAILKTSFDSEGIFTINAEYDGGQDYKRSTAKATVNVTSVLIKNTEITAGNVEYTEGDVKDISVKLVDGDKKAVANADVVVTVNGITKTAKTNSLGEASFNIDLKAGDYTALIEFKGNGEYASTSTTSIIKVNAKPAEENTTSNETADQNSTSNETSGENTTAEQNSTSGVTFDVNVDGNNAVASLTAPNATGKLTVKVDGKEMANVDLADGKAIANIDNLSAGLHDLELKYSGDGKHPADSTTYTVIILKKETKLKDAIINVDSKFSRVANDFAAGERGAMFYATLTDMNGNPLANKTVQIAVNGPIYNVTTDKDGKAGLTVNLANANTYTYALSFKGDKEYNAAPLASSKLTVTKKSTSLTASDKSFKTSAKKTISVTLKTSKNSYDGKTYLSAGKKLTLKVNGKTYTAKTNAKGVAKFTIKLTKKGTHKTKISFAGDKTYKATEKSIKISIK